MTRLDYDTELTPAEFRAIRLRLHLPVKYVADMLGVWPTQIVRWETTRLPPTYACEAMVRLYDEFRADVQHMKTFYGKTPSIYVGPNAVGGKPAEYWLVVAFEAAEGVKPIKFYEPVEHEDEGDDD